jgi:hypothetical protein
LQSGAGSRIIVFAIGNEQMTRPRALAIAATEQQAEQARLLLAAGMLLLPAFLLLLLISP